MNVVFCWSDISGYMATCWRALAQTEGIRLFVVAFQVGTNDKAIAFGEQTMQGVPHHLLTAAQKDDREFVAKLVAEQRPDAVVLGGWFHRPYTALVWRPEFGKTRFVI